jgi:hypothetical protein
LRPTQNQHKFRTCWLVTPYVRHDCPESRVDVMVDISAVSIRGVTKHKHNFCCTNTIQRQWHPTRNQFISSLSIAVPPPSRHHQSPRIISHREHRLSIPTRIGNGKQVSHHQLQWSTRVCCLRRTTWLPTFSSKPQTMMDQYNDNNSGPMNPTTRTGMSRRLPRSGIGTNHATDRHVKTDIGPCKQNDCSTE